MSDKTVESYRQLLRHLEIAPEEFVMIGNSIKSDVLPVLELGAYALHVPYHTTWEYEKVEKEIKHPKFSELSNILDVLTIIN